MLLSDSEGYLLAAPRRKLHISSQVRLMNQCSNYSCRCNFDIIETISRYVVWIVIFNLRFILVKLCTFKLEILNHK